MSRSLASVRSITDAEASVVERALLLAATDPSANAFSVEVRSLQVVGQCGCGCASIDFRIPAQGQIARIVADGVAKAPNGEHLGVIVWALDDELSGLEVYSYSEAPAPLPTLASVSSYENASDSNAA